MAELSNNIGKLAQVNEDGEDALNLVETEADAHVNQHYAIKKVKALKKARDQARALKKEKEKQRLKDEEE